MENETISLESEQALIRRCQQGEREAFTILMQQYHRRIFNVAFRMLGDYAQADETAQEVFIRAYRGIDGFQGKARFLTWLYAITVNLTRNRIRSNCRMRRLETTLDPSGEGDCAGSNDVPDTTTIAPDKALLNKEKHDLIHGAIQSLAEEFRSVIILRDVEALSYEDVARILNINIGTVKSRLSRARRLLQEKLREVF
jgi:RNA polymerase sigma factor, sigma-70 family